MSTCPSYQTADWQYGVEMGRKEHSPMMGTLPKTLLLCALFWADPEDHKGGRCFLPQWKSFRSLDATAQHVFPTILLWINLDDGGEGRVVGSQGLFSLTATMLAVQKSSLQKNAPSTPTRKATGRIEGPFSCSRTLIQEGSTVGERKGGRAEGLEPLGCLFSEKYTAAQVSSGEGRSSW